jgi:hypothetical protein
VFVAQPSATIAGRITVAVGSSRHACEEAPVEDTRFDHLAKVFGAQKTRRLTLGALLGGALSALGLAEVEAARSGKCRRKPGACETCKKGKCEKKNGEKHCKRGKIKPKANGTACSGGTCESGSCISPTGLVLDPVGGGGDGDGGGGGGGGGTTCPVCQVLQGGVCGNAPVGTACNGTGKCNGSGTCNPAPACTPRGGACTLAAADLCCSDTCAVTRFSGICAKSALGEQCITSDDCNEGFTFLAQCGNTFTCEPLVIMLP